MVAWRSGTQSCGGLGGSSSPEHSCNHGGACQGHPPSPLRTCESSPTGSRPVSSSALLGHRDSPPALRLSTPTRGGCEGAGETSSPTPWFRGLPFLIRSTRQQADSVIFWVLTHATGKPVSASASPEAGDTAIKRLLWSWTVSVQIPEIPLRDGETRLPTFCEFCFSHFRVTVRTEWDDACRMRATMPGPGTAHGNRQQLSRWRCSSATGLSAVGPAGPRRSGEFSVAEGWATASRRRACPSSSLEGARNQRPAGFSLTCYVTLAG